MLDEFGWDDEWALVLAEVRRSATSECGRVTAQSRDRWVVQLETGSSVARIPSASFRGPTPVTGDWVLIERGPSPDDPVSILDVLPRRSAISRGAAGTGTAEQVLAANIDVAWIVQGLDTPLNLRRIERYLAVIWESGAVPEIILTKADLAADSANAKCAVESVAMGITIHVVSIEQPDSIQALRSRLRPGRTVALLGPSGAGKSTLINALAGDVVAVPGAVRESDHKGRHTTTGRELFQMPGGALLLDTPGLRELRVWDLAEGLQHAFPEIAELSAACRFRDCQHDVEPGCAVLAAVALGTLDADRLASFQKLRAEAAYAERRSDPRARASAVSRHKTALKTLKYHPKYRNKD
ncbi:MAG TPA: ribosome small subunit-dependent GTPase A [Planctomycetaceae bacterium]|nr:ribosome small subunit-dependent GTPase A [Planctomycetaceae bacterium]